MIVLSNIKSVQKHLYYTNIILVKKAISKKQDKIYEKRKATKEAIKLIKKLIYPEIDISINQNAKFTTKDLLDVLVHIAQTKDFAHNGTATFKELNPSSEPPSSWTMLYHLKKLESVEETKELFERIFDVTFNFAKQNYNILNRRKLDLGIDIHKIPFYGDKNSPYILGAKHERGTSHFYQFISCAIVVAGRRFTIDALPVILGQNHQDLSDYLHACRIKRNMSDYTSSGGISSAEVVEIIKEVKALKSLVKEWVKKTHPHLHV